MATGLQGANANARNVVIRIADAVTADTAVPVYATDGINLQTELDKVYPAGSAPTSCLLHIYNTAGSGTVAATVRLFGGETVSAVYSVVGIGTATLAGVANGGASHDEVTADLVGRWETLTMPAVLTKMATRFTGITGTSPSFNVDLVFQKSAVF